MATPQDIQNSEILLDLSNQIVESINERKKILNIISENEKAYFSTVKQQQKLSTEIAANAEKYLGYQIKSKDLAKQIKAEEDNIAKSKFSFSNIQNDITKQYQDALKANSQLIQQIKEENDLNNSFNSNLDRTTRIYNDLKTAKERGENVTYRELAAARRRYLSAREEATVSDKLLKTLQDKQKEQEGIAKTAAEIIKSAKEAEIAAQKELDFLEENLRIRKQIEKSTGLLGGMAKAASKIPGIGQYLKADEATDEMEKMAAAMEEKLKGSSTSFSNRLQIGMKGLSVLTKGLIENLKSPEVIITSIVGMLFKGSENIANFRKELGMSYGNAYELNNQLSFVGSNINDAYITGEKLKKSFIDLSKEMGFVANYGSQSLVTMTNLTGRLGMSNKEAAQLTTLSRFQSKDTEKVLDNVGRTVTSMNKQKGTAIMLKDVMKDIGNVSMATAVSLGKNPVAIAEAVVAARQLGTTLEQMEKTADSLLNFETSIENELKAELLTGKQMNLERARAAALSNDMKTLTEEIGKNQEVIDTFSKGNRLEQQAVAEALGMSREDLAKMVYQQEAMKIGAEGVRAKYGEQAYEQLKAQNAQEKFTNAVEKLKAAFSGIIQLLTPILDAVAWLAEGVASLTSTWWGMSLAIGAIALMYLPKLVGGFASMAGSVKDMAKNAMSLFSKGGIKNLLGGGAAEKVVPEAPIPGTKGAGGLGKFMDKMPSASSMLKGAAAILVLSGALFVAAKAFQEFAIVKWEDVGKGAVGLASIAGIAMMLGKATNSMIKGALAISLLGTSLIPTAKAFQMFASVKWGDMAKAGVAIVGLAAVAGIMGTQPINGFIIAGAFALGLLGAALIPFAFAARIATPAIEAFGNVITKVFNGLATVITAAAGGIATIFGSLQNVDVAKLLAIGPALTMIGIGLASLGAGGVIGAIGAFLTGDPIKKIQKLAESGDGLQKAATGLQGMAGALTQVSAALAAIDISKIEALEGFATKMTVGSVVKGITDFITAPIKAVGNMVEGATGGGENDAMIKAINEVRDEVKKLYTKDTTINMDGKKVGTTLTQGSTKLA